MLLGDSFNPLAWHRTLSTGAKVTTCRVTGRVSVDLFGTLVCGVFVLCSLLFSNFFQTIVQGGVLKYTSQFLTSCEDHANSCWLKDLLTCGRKDCLAAQEHFGVLVLL